jgi:tetratricopeptide (TPR) repeat protein
MATDPDKNAAAAKSLEEEILAAISGFEKILEAMPDDRASLEALAHAYDQMGQKEKARDYLLRLGEVLVEEGDVTSARELVERLLPHAEASPLARELLGRIQSLTAERVSGPTPVQVSTDFNMAEELSFAWNLLQGTQISQEEYAGIVQDLTEMCAGENIATVSVLHVLEARAFRNLEAIIAWVSRECGTPFLSMSSFDLQNQAIAALPMDFMLRRGAMVFEFLGDTALVVLMNPYDQSLRRDVEALTGKRCHFFLTMPSEFDQAIDKVTDVMAEPAAGAEEKPAQS